ncbi:MAG: hypothetical protein WC595_01725 [Candidatus Nanoarchaeia archaeon]
MLNDLKVSDILFYLGLASIFFWALAKSLGIIHSPTWQKMLPYFGAVFTAGVGWNRFMHLEKRVGKMVNGLMNVEKEVQNVSHRLGLFQEEVHHQFKVVEKRLDGVEKKLSI